MEQLKKFFKKNYINLILIITTVVGMVTTYVVAMSEVVLIKAKVVNVRTGPMLSYNVMGQLKQGDQVQVLEQKNGWDKIRLDGNKIGWIASWLLDTQEVDSATNAVGNINSDRVNIRQYATTNSKILAQLAKGDQINVVYSKDDWSQIIFDDQVGWVNNKLFDLTSSDETDNRKILNNVYVIKPTIPLYSKANRNSAVLDNLQQSESLSVLGSSGDYYQIKSNKNITGYVARNLVTTEIPRDRKNQVKIIQPNSLSKTTIVIDAGHGGEDPGASSNDQKHDEKDYALKFAQSLQYQLKASGVNVVMTRDRDNFISLEDRVVLTNKTKPNAFISLHLDSSNVANEASGITTYYYSEKKDLALAKSLSKQFNDLKIPNRGTNFGDFEVIRENSYPGVLIEIGYINSDQDFKNISSPIYRELFVSRIVAGLKNYFK